MAIIRQYVAPFIALLIFFAALVAVSARIFLPADMAAPAPIEEVSEKATPNAAAGLPTLDAPTLPTSASN